MASTKTKKQGSGKKRRAEAEDRPGPEAEEGGAGRNAEEDQQQGLANGVQHNGVEAKVGGDAAERKKQKKQKKRKAAGAGEDDIKEAAPDAAAAELAGAQGAAPGGRSPEENGDPREGDAAGSEKEKKKDKKKKKEKKKNEGESGAAGLTAEAAQEPQTPGSGAGAAVPEDVPVSWGSGDVSVRAVGDGVSALWPLPLTSFEALGSAVDPRLVGTLQGFQRPSPIQAWAWPVLLPLLAQQQQQGAGAAPPAKKSKKEAPGAAAEAARDLVGIAATGSGKTLAFGIPALQHALQQPGAGQPRDKDAWKKGKGAGVPAPCALVLAPTRELALQIAEVLEAAGKACGMGCVCVFGGAPKGAQKAALAKHPAVVVATPGRLEDLLQDQACSLHNVTYAVLDEADRMLDLGFEPHIRKILAQTHKDRRTVMLSATWPMSVAKLAMDFLNRPVQVTVGSAAQDAGAASGGGPVANRNVKQIVEVVEPFAKDNKLQALLQQYHKSRKNRVLVFVLYKKEAQRVEGFLTSRGWSVGALHGDKSQSDRTRAVTKFKSAEVPLLVATDVAARGLDIPDVECVINYTFPLTTEDYVHRIGRTGRAGKTGISHTLFTIQDKLRAGELVNVLREAGQEVPDDLLKFGTAVKKKESKLYGAHFREITMDSAKPTKVTFADSDDE